MNAVNVFFCTKSLDLKVEDQPNQEISKMEVNKRGLSKKYQKKFRRCERCFTLLSRQKHSCSKKQAIFNMEKAAEEIEIEDGLAWNILKKKKKSLKNYRRFGVERKDDGSLDVFYVHKNRRAGKNLIMDLQNGVVTSRRQRKKAIAAIKRAFGRNSLEAKIDVDIENEADDLSEYFNTRKMTFARTKIKTTIFHEETAIVCTDVPGLIQKVKNKFGIENSGVKIGLDGGRKSLKACLSIYDLDKPRKSSSVQKVFIIFLCYDVQENYGNIQQIWNLLNLNNIGPFKLCADLKIYNIICGLKSHSSHNPCTYCPAKNINGTFEDV